MINIQKQKTTYLSPLVSGFVLVLRFPSRIKMIAAIKRHNKAVTEILLKVVLNTITLIPPNRQTFKILVPFRPFFKIKQQKHLDEFYAKNCIKIG